MSSKKTIHELRMKLAKRALSNYDTFDEDPNAALTDLLADLRTFAHAHGLDFVHSDTTAIEHFNDESQPCPGCSGHGYFASEVCGASRPEGFCGVEIERCDECQKFDNDTDACDQFVKELECYDDWALKQLASILDKKSLKTISDFHFLMSEKEAGEAGVITHTPEYIEDKKRYIVHVPSGYRGFNFKGWNGTEVSMDRHPGSYAEGYVSVKSVALGNAVVSRSWLTEVGKPREPAGSERFNGPNDLFKQVHDWIETHPEDEILDHEESLRSLDFIKDVMHAVAELHMDVDTEHRAYDLAGTRTRAMRREDLEVLAKHAIVLEYRAFPAEFESDINDQEEKS